ncbi:MAG TPA: DNA mismatch repair endonuclease MutL [Polyangiales bacterium]|nr:DNA mismatch repair endonuclease MutL [Polyangiales bacterium]
MSASIRILPDTLADQIAAGEVVERPASVVKELIENAVDAGANRVNIDIEEGGLRLIRVSDDGSGMSPEDAQLSIQRHATSKLRTRDDLFCIRTLGFRGEALPSIASVSRFTLTTRPRSEDAGTQVRLDGGAALGTEPVGCAPGTVIEVRELFYNVPARLKFLKSKATESGHIANACLRAALAYPELALTVSRDRRQTQEFLHGQDVLERVRSAFPGEELAFYETSCEGAVLRAALSAPERARSGAAHLHLFVNRRPVRDLAVSRCVSFAYGSVLPPGRFPVGAVYIELDPKDVDVNVHPQKLEVRFARGRTLLDAITRSLAHKLGTAAFSGPAARSRSFWEQRLGAVGPDGSDAGSRISEIGALIANSTAQPYPTGGQTEEEDPWGLTPVAAREPWQSATHVADGGASAAPTLLEPPGAFGGLRFLGQSRKTFLICESELGIQIIDQHAADERVRFDQLLKSYRARTVKVQPLLFPERVECTELEADLIEQHQAELVAAGLECNRLGVHTVAVAAVPVLLARASPTRLLRDLLSELTRSGERAFRDAIDMALATMACHAAIRAGDALSHEEAVALLHQLDRVQDFQRHCPHGRPIVCSLPFSELEHRLGR